MGPATPVRMLCSNFINDFRRDMTKHWRILSSSQTYKGRGWLPIRRKKRLFKPAIVAWLAPSPDTPQRVNTTNGSSQVSTHTAITADRAPPICEVTSFSIAQ
ncbi:hypothetical protein AX14_011098, partial [Amanita brunnescens Koide BX004]